MAIAVTVFCVLLFVFMRAVGHVFGSTVGTLAGIGCVGVIAVSIGLLALIALLPVIFPVAAVALAIYVFVRSKYHGGASC